MEGAFPREGKGKRRMGEGERILVVIGHGRRERGGVGRGEVGLEREGEREMQRRGAEEVMWA